MQNREFFLFLLNEVLDRCISNLTGVNLLCLLIVYDQISIDHQRLLIQQNLDLFFSFLFQVFPLQSRFNKGRLYNTAIQYVRNQTWNITCLILHDVDLIPEDDGNFYTCESRYPKHTTSRVRKLDSDRGYTKYYEFLIGGVLILTYDMYRNLNGFSNLYWGWGGEDDDLALRLVQKRMCVVRPSFELAIYIGKARKNPS